VIDICKKNNTGTNNFHGGTNCAFFLKCQLEYFMKENTIHDFYI